MADVDGSTISLWLWFWAALPIMLLLGLVVAGKVSTKLGAVIVLAVALVVGTAVFGAGPSVVGVALGKGIWLGLWILFVVWPALLLYRVASVGGLERIGRIFSSILPNRRANLLIVAWVFPSFIQGVAGFGTPIAIAAPLLVAMGWSKTRAVIYPLIGYHWSVTFGSMGSSFYMAFLTGGFGPQDQSALAVQSAALLAMLCLLGGAAVLVLDGGLSAVRETWVSYLVIGIPMATALIVVASAVPAIATLASGAVGFLMITVLAVVGRRRAGAAAARGRAAGPGTLDETSAELPANPTVVLAPYLYLLVIALPVFLIPRTSAWVRANLVIAPSWPATATGRGWTNDAVAQQVPLPLFGHPGSYILLACLLGYLTYRMTGLWRGPDTQGLVGKWLRSLPAASISILVLACLATVMVDAGMIFVLAVGAAEVTGPVYPLIAPMVGALGSFMTGSTTSSNALFAPLQGDIARLLDLPPELLVAAQTAGGNVGNSIAPVVVLIGATAVGAPEKTSTILRACLVPAGCLLAVLSAVVLALSLT